MEGVKVNSTWRHTTSLKVSFQPFYYTVAWKKAHNILCTVSVFEELFGNIWYDTLRIQEQMGVDSKPELAVCLWSMHGFW